MQWHSILPLPSLPHKTTCTFFPSFLTCCLSTSEKLKTSLAFISFLPLNHTLPPSQHCTHKRQGGLCRRGIYSSPAIVLLQHPPIPSIPLAFFAHTHTLPFPILHCYTCRRRKTRRRKGRRTRRKENGGRTGEQANWANRRTGTGLGRNPGLIPSASSLPSSSSPPSHLSPLSHQW